MNLRSVKGLADAIIREGYSRCSKPPGMNAAPKPEPMT